jgi:hypothetical protein
MPIRSIRPRGPLTLACAALTMLIVPSVAAAATKPVDLRVVTSQGQTLAEQRQYTATTDVPTDPGATCFGAGTGGSGNPVRLGGATALGALVEGAGGDRDLRPVSVTDAFTFGLGVCGIGGSVASGSAFWDVKQNHVESQVGADQIVPKPGDDLLWYLTPNFPAPPELALAAPARVRSGEQFTVHVQEFGLDGSGAPVAGAKVSGGGATATTDASGAAQLTASDSGQVTLRATRGADIPSNEAGVCVAEQLDGCPAAQGLRIFGSSKRDKIKGTKGPDTIKSRRGNDVIRVRGGAGDSVDCGKGRDRVKVDQTDEVKRCEKVRGI